MSLDALLAPLPIDEPTPCKIARMVTELDEPYSSALQKLVDVTYPNGGLSDMALRARLKAAGLPVSISTIHYHRRGLCSCVGKGLAE